MTLIEELTALELLARLPDQTPLTVAEAAIFCRCSISKMNKMRLPNYPVQGPVYSQPGKKGARGANQGVVYLKRDLLEWIDANRISDTHAAAVRKNQMFVTLSNVLEEHAFWRAPNGKIAGLVEKTDVEVFFTRLFSWGIEWLPAIESAGEDWDAGALGELKSMEKSIDQILSDARDTLKARVERAEIGQGASVPTTANDKSALIDSL